MTRITNGTTRAAVAAIIPSAGAGTRLGGRTGKAFVSLNGQPLLVHTLRVLQQSPAICWIVLVVRSRDQAQPGQLVEGLHSESLRIADIYFN